MFLIFADLYYKAYFMYTSKDLLRLHYIINIHLIRNKIGAITGRYRFCIKKAPVENLITSCRKHSNTQ